MPIKQVTPRRRRALRDSTRKVSRGPKLSHTRRPSDLSVEEWQRQLRRQFGRAQPFKIENIGEEPVFSEFSVSNPRSGSSYRVAIRGAGPGENFCACPDFLTNDLGTCKHIEFVLGRLERQRGGKKALAQGFQPPYSEIYLQYGSERLVRFRAGTECPAGLAKRAARLFNGSTANTLPVAHFPQLQHFLASAQQSGHELRCYEDALDLIAQIRDADERRRIIDAAYPQGAASASLQKLLKTDLYPYQAEGALFAARAGRSLLGDEMGLGKTIQAIAATELFAQHFGAERVLIVCPTSLKHQWQRELARFTDRRALVIAGLRAAREQQYAQSGLCKIVNYDVIARDLDLIHNWSPDVVIVDEAQRIKNWNTVAARALKRIESPYAIVLTGTPLENRLEELLSIVQFVDRHRLGPTWRLRHEHQVLDESGRVIGYRDLDRIGKTLAPILLRRRKSEVLDQLPARVDNTMFVPMTDEQKRHHEENRNIVDRIVRRWRKTGFLSDADQRRLTCCLQNMRMSCNSTYLLDGRTDHGSKADELMALLGELLERPDAKAVVFSQWVRTHELLIRRLRRKRWGYVLFHGGVPGEKRGALVDRFREDPSCRVFLSTDAGGVGLNLQHSASAIINMDLPWNPAVLEQRIGRVYRLGQTRSVRVVNFVAEGTIEERMLSLLAFKKSLFAGVLDGGESEVFLGGTRLTKFMESVETVAGAAHEPESADVEAVSTTGAMVAAAPASSDRAFARPVERPASDGDRARAQRGASPDASLDGGSGRPRPAATPVTPMNSCEQQLRTAAASHTPTDNISGRARSEGAAGASMENSWAPLLSAGLELVKTLAAVSGGDGDEIGRTMPNPWVETDARTGRSYLRLPMPEPHVVQQLSDALSSLVNSLSRSSSDAAEGERR
jgi:superfamily II DNA or RNA helicase